MKYVPFGSVFYSNKQLWFIYDTIKTAINKPFHGCIGVRECSLQHAILEYDINTTKFSIDFWEHYLNDPRPFLTLDDLVHSRIPIWTNHWDDKVNAVPAKMDIKSTITTFENQAHKLFVVGNQLWTFYIHEGKRLSLEEFADHVQQPQGWNKEMRELSYKHMDFLQSLLHWNEIKKWRGSENTNYNVKRTPMMKNALEKLSKERMMPTPIQTVYRTSLNKVNQQCKSAKEIGYLLDIMDDNAPKNTGMLFSFALITKIMTYLYEKGYTLVQPPEKGFPILHENETLNEEFTPLRYAGLENESIVMTILGTNAKTHCKEMTRIQDEIFSLINLSGRLLEDASDNHTWEAWFPKEQLWKPAAVAHLIKDPLSTYWQNDKVTGCIKGINGRIDVKVMVESFLENYYQNGSIEVPASLSLPFKTLEKRNDYQKWTLAELMELKSGTIVEKGEKNGIICHVDDLIFIRWANGKESPIADLALKPLRVLTA